MSISWTINSYVFADLDFKSMRGSPGLGFYRLVAEISIALHSRPEGQEVIVTNIEGDLAVIGKDNVDHYVGRMRRQGHDSPLITFPHTYSTNLQLEVEIDDRRIEAIEKIRAGGDLNFKLNLYGLANSATEKRPQNLNSWMNFRVNQGTSIEMLEQMGYRRTLLLEVTLSDGEPIRPEAMKHLQNAQTHLLRGHYRDAVGACRDVLEALSKELGDEKDTLPETINNWFEGSKKMGKDERIRLVRRALKVLTHPARHADEVSSKIEWEPEDAKAILIFSAAMVQMAGSRE